MTDIYNIQYNTQSFYWFVYINLLTNRLLVLETSLKPVIGFTDLHKKI